MTDFNKHINPYTAKDFERYYTGQMTAVEMHQLEKSALEDPFLQDALEGYQFTRQGVTDVAGLKEQVDQRIQKGRVISFDRKERTTGYWRIAAMVLLTAGMGWLVYNVALDNETKDIAVTEKPSEALPAAADRAADTGAPSTEMKATDDSNNATPTASTPALRNKKVNQKQMEVSQKRTENTAPFLSIPAPDTQPQTDMRTQSEAAPPDVALQRSDSSPIVGYGTARKERVDKDSYSLSNKARNNKMEESVVGQTSVPSGIPTYPIAFEDAFPKNGNAHYNDYVAQHIRVPRNEKNEAVRGQVQLSFNVNSKGKPVAIKVEKSLCKPCDSEAVRLLKERPPWIQETKDKRGTFSIRF